MSKLLFIIALLSLSLTKAQNRHLVVEIFYDYTLNNSSSPYSVNSLLTFNNDESIYEIDHTKSFIDSISQENKTEEIVFGLTSNNNTFVYKDFLKNKMTYTNSLQFKDFHIGDSLNIMNWELHDKKKEILGYTCTEATTLYGGRLYIAYFTDEIPISNGPWRFNGLPGVILDVKSIDNYFNITATSISIKKEKREFTNPYENEKLMTWDEFLQLYRKKYDEVLRNGMTPMGPSHTIPKKGIVEYIKD